MKKNSFAVILILIFVILILTGVTYAWYAWSSTDNTNITMKIGEYTTVTFLNGNEIKLNNLSPVYNYNDGEKTTFTLTFNNEEENKIFEYNVYLDIDTISEELRNTTFKYVLLDDMGQIINQGNFEKALSSSTLTISENNILSNGTTSYIFIIYLDGNEENNPNMMNKTISGSLRVVVNKEKNISQYNPITDYDYELITEENENIIKLKKYIGSSSTVNIPSTYEINNIIYKVNLPGYDDSICQSNNCIVKHYSTFQDTNIKKVYLDDNLDITDMTDMFLNCTSLIKVPIVPHSAKILNNTFNGCSNLTGTIKINSSDIKENSNIFSNTIKNITIEVPENTDTYYIFNESIPNNINLTTYKK